MLKLNKKHGFGLIEVVCALGILCTASIYIYDVNIKCIQLKRYNEDCRSYLQFSENLKNILKNNYSYEELKKIFQNKSNKCTRVYIHKDNLNINSLKNCSLEKLIYSNNGNKLPYGEVFITYEEEEVMKVTINIFFKNKNKVEKLTTYFYKGDY